MDTNQRERNYKLRRFQRLRRGPRRLQPRTSRGAERCFCDRSLCRRGLNLYKCSISSANPACSNTPFINLTHAYGCDPYGALAHVHPDQHAMAYTIPSAGADLMYFANDGGCPLTR